MEQAEMHHQIIKKLSVQTTKLSFLMARFCVCYVFENFSAFSNNVLCIYYLLTECKGRTRKYNLKVFHTARACEGCLENQRLVFPGTARAPS